MDEKVITYYAIVNEFSSLERPAGVLRRIEDDDGQNDETFSRDLRWEHTPLLYAAERGDTQNELIPISAEEAERIVERIRGEVNEG